MEPVLAFLCMHAASALASPANRSFDIVYINLERHRSKRAHVEQMLRHAGCSFSRFNAVDGLELCSQRRSILDYTEGTCIVPTDDTVQQRIDARNAGRAGCHLSHLIVLRRIEASGTDRPVLVLEDDVDLVERFVEKVESVIADPPGRWDVILLGGIVREKWWRRRRYRHVVEVHYQACLHAYLLSGAESARRIADVVDTSRCPGRPVDLLIADAFRDDTGFVFYCFSPMIAVQRRDLFDSDITVPRKKPFYARYLANPFQSAFLRPLESSLSKASAPNKGVAKPVSSQLAPLLAFLLLFLCTRRAQRWLVVINASC